MIDASLLVVRRIVVGGAVALDIARDEVANQAAQRRTGHYDQRKVEAGDNLAQQAVLIGRPVRHEVHEKEHLRGQHRSEGEQRVELTRHSEGHLGWTGGHGGVAALIEQTTHGTALRGEHTGLVRGHSSSGLVTEDWWWW